MARAGGVLNSAALIASDTGLPDLAADLCWRQHKIFSERGNLTQDIAVMALMPLVNIARLLIREGDGRTAYELLQQLYRAAPSLRTGGPPNLRTVRRYVESRVCGGKGGGGSVTRPTAAYGRPDDACELGTSEGAGLVNTLANLLRGHRLTVEMVGALRVRVTGGADSRGVEVECLRRPSGGDRCWFSWGGGVWLCEAGNPIEAGVQVKAALRRVGAVR